MANGFHQKPGIGCNETFSPVVKHSPIRLVLGLTVSKKGHVRLLNIQNASYMVISPRKFI
ncbi:hypothetical protein C1H46_008895 [Malus baccata]|uniref:Uncharacterized protein n=1 Tax=Malus baccata TaxID=106549 RepID=A0A540N4N8_MALBA|nr:hypothetical protein C1H46_008895 [Malus baccata]